MFKINKISLLVLLCLSLSVKFALAQDAPISAITVNAPEVQTYQTAAPSGFLLSQNFQHPFNVIKFQVEKQENVKLMVVDELGREVITVINKQYNPGSYEIKLDASDLGSGVYFFRLSTPAFSETKKMLSAK